MFELGSDIKWWEAERCKQYEIYRRISDEIILDKKCLQMGKTWVFPDNLSAKNNSSTRNTLTQGSVKKVMLIVFWDMKWPIITDFLEKGLPVNNVSYYQLPR